MKLEENETLRSMYRQAFGIFLPERGQSGSVPQFRGEVERRGRGLRLAFTPHAVVLVGGGHVEDVEKGADLVIRQGPNTKKCDVQKERSTRCR